MALDYDALMARRRRDDPVDYGPRDAMGYALAVGFGRDPLDRDELPFVYEGGEGLRVVPTLASTLAMPPLLDDCGWDFSRVLHGEERLTLHRPLLDADALRLTSRVSAVRDLGPGRGAIIDVEIAARDAGGAPVFSIVRTAFARGDGGFGGPSGPRAPKPAMPSRSPDLSCSTRTRPDQALLFRLCGDFNPLHADPELAGSVGLERPLLHGLCTFGVACRAILATICEYDPTLIRAIDVRFSSPVFPGETVVTEMWQQANVVTFRARVAERNRVVLNHGRCVLAT